MALRSRSKDRLPLHRDRDSSARHRGCPRLAFRHIRSLLSLGAFLCLYLFIYRGSASAGIETSSPGVRDAPYPGRGGSLHAPLNDDNAWTRGKGQAQQPLEDTPPPRIINGIDFSRFAYVQYATTAQYLCNAVMIFEALTRYNSSASRLLLYNDDWAPRTPQKPKRSFFSIGRQSSPPPAPVLQGDSYIHRLLLAARDRYGAVLKPMPVLHLAGEWTWAESFNKLLAFNQTQYARVLSLDSDATLLRHLDSLFISHPATGGVAAPRAYWLEDQDVLSSQVMLIEPSAGKWGRVRDRIARRKDDEFDMEIVNAVFGPQAERLQHRGLDLLSGEFRKGEHGGYLGGEGEWNATGELEAASYVHFSDWPVKKPWFYSKTVKAPEGGLDLYRPECKMLENGGKDCADRDAWIWLYDDFLKRREARTRRPCALCP